MIRYRLNVTNIYYHKILYYHHGGALILFGDSSVFLFFVLVLVHILFFYQIYDIITILKIHIFYIHSLILIDTFKSISIWPYWVLNRAMHLYSTFVLIIGMDIQQIIFRLLIYVFCCSFRHLPISPTSAVLPDHSHNKFQPLLCHL